MNFNEKFKKLTGKYPFPWQEALYARFMDDDIPNVCNIPTGLGKTSVMAIWLIALAQGARVPRRLVYVVNRRTVVDQTTNEATKLQKNAYKIGIQELAISTLRGQFADNQEWSSDPSRPAVICGTVDMIGSRLLFNGYRIGFKSKPLHAGFLGQDALLLHDEAHLEPAFQKLIESIEDNQKYERQRQQGDDMDLPWPGLKIMALSATGRNGDEIKNPEGLTDKEKDPPANLPDPPSKPIHYVWRRLKARKTLKLHGVEDGKKLAVHIAGLALKHTEAGAAVLIFARTIKTVTEISKALTTKNGLSPENVQLLTGTMRGYERERLINHDPVFARFMLESDRSSDVTPAEGAVCLVCTSAGEVGVNLSGDHMVCDLSTFDSMAQRFGRLNRFGDHPDAQIDVVYPQEIEATESKRGSKEKTEEMDIRRQQTLDLLKQLKGDASPLALEKLDVSARIAAFAPEPTILPATEILFDAWAMTTIQQKMPGRPPVTPYLHGIAQWEPPRTSVAWRNETACITKDLIEHYGMDFPRSLLDDYPLKPQELLNDTSERVYEELKKLGSRLGEECTIWIVGERGDIEVIKLGKLLGREKKLVITRISDCTILLPPWAGGLSDQGTLDGAAEHDANCKLIYDIADEWLGEGSKKRRQRAFSRYPQPVEGPEGMALIRVIDTVPDADEYATSSESEAETAADFEKGTPLRKYRYWFWYVRPRDAEDATAASAAPVTWDDHTGKVVEEATRILEHLKWPEEWTALERAVILAGGFHDLGKKRELWQLSIGNPDPTTWYAKPGKPIDGPRWRPRHISPYRHELGSVLDLISTENPDQDQLCALSNEMKDVVLHLIAAHHGFARPHFPEDHTIDPDYPQSKADEAAIEVMRRFARLQRRFGRWGLAYLESLLHAADWAASADDSRKGTQNQEETR